MPGTLRIAAAIASTISGRRPSLTFGMHSMIGMGYMYNRRASQMAVPLREHESSASRIEELLLAGLDHYFNGQHELAISVWTRVLFLDRSHARARAYIERARSAIAERQREGEELLQ